MVSNVCIHLLERCNLTCVNCWSNSGPTGRNELKAGDVIAFLAVLKTLGLSQVSFSGGEPLLYKDIVDLIKATVAMGIRVTVTTNGVLQQRVQESLAKLTIDERAFLRFRVSIEGGRETHEAKRGAGTYTRALNGAVILKQAGQLSGINTVICNDLPADFGELAEQLGNVGVAHWALLTLAPRGRTGFGTMVPSRSVVILETAVDVARHHGFNGEIALWDYVSHQHAYLLVEHDGRVIIPGVMPVDDWTIGTLQTVSAEVIKAAVAHAKTGGTTFFSWKG